MILAASFSETFYSLKRIIIVNSKVKCELSNKQRRLSLMLTILFPYIKIKLSQLVEKYKLEEVDDSKVGNYTHNFFFNLYFFTQIIFKIIF